MIPIGNYKAVAVPLEGPEDGIQIARWSANSEKKSVLIYFQILDEGEHQGTVLPWQGYFTEKTWEGTLTSLRLIGYTGDDLSKLGSQKLDMQVLVAVGYNTWEGVTRPRVNFINDPNRVVAMKLNNPMAPADIAGFASYMKNHFKNPKFAEVTSGDRVDRDKLAFKHKHPGSMGANAAKAAASGSGGGDEWQPPSNTNGGSPGPSGGPDDDLPF